MKTRTGGKDGGSADVQEHVLKAYTSRIPLGDAKMDLSH